jgi:predicted MFS family arabinose efflux permease
LVAITTLHATTFQVGLLVALQSAAFLVIGLPAGAWCDRMRRRPVLIAADLARAVLLITVPVAARRSAGTWWNGSPHRSPSPPTR